MGRRTDIDWEAIQRDYRLGQFTRRQIAKIHDVSVSAICRKVEKEKWVQDLSQEVRERTRAALLSNATQSDIESVEVAVQTNVALVREHRSDIGDGRALVRSMLAELAEASSDRADIEAKVEEETRSDGNQKRRNAMLRAVALPSRSTIIVNLAAALKTLVGLERQAFGLDAQTPVQDEAAPTITPAMSAKEASDAYARTLDGDA